MSRIRAAKEELVQEIVSNIEDSQVMVLVDYRGLSVSELTDLRSQFREAGVTYKVYKNTMLNLAFEEQEIEGLEELLAGPTAVAFGKEDPVSAAKIIKDFAKKHDKLEVKGGYLDGQVMDATGVNNLASLPSRDQLIAQVLGTMNAPIQELASVSNQIISSLVYAVNAIKEQKEEEVA